MSMTIPSETCSAFKSLAVVICCLGSTRKCVLLTGNLSNITTISSSSN